MAINKTYDWFYKFLKRNPEIIVKKSKGLCSVAGNNSKSNMRIITLTYLKICFSEAHING